jgi:hypothetical protein
VRLKSLLISLDLNEAWRREVGSSRVSQSVCKLNCVANPAREAWGTFYIPQGNLAVGVSETWTCPGRGPDMFVHHLWNPSQKPDKAGVT